MSKEAQTNWQSGVTEEDLIDRYPKIYRELRAIAQVQYGKELRIMNWGGMDPSYRGINYAEIHYDDQDDEIIFVVRVLTWDSLGVEQMVLYEHSMTSIW